MSSAATTMEPPSVLEARAALAARLESDEFKHMAASLDLPVLRALVPPECGVTHLDLQMRIDDAMVNLDTALISIRTAPEAVRNAVREQDELASMRARLEHLHLGAAARGIPAPAARAAAAGAQDAARPLAGAQAAALANEDRGNDHEAKRVPQGVVVEDASDEEDDEEADDDDEDGEDDGRRRRRRRRRRPAREREYERLMHHEQWEDEAGAVQEMAELEEMVAAMEDVEELDEERREGDSEAQFASIVAFREQVRQLRDSLKRQHEYAHVLEVLLAEAVPRLEWNRESAIVSIARSSSTRRTIQLKKFMRKSEKIALLLLQYYARDRPAGGVDEESMEEAYRMIFQSLQPDRFMHSWSAPPDVWRRRMGTIYECIRVQLEQRTYTEQIDRQEATDAATKAVAASAAAAGYTRRAEEEERDREGVLLSAIGGNLPTTREVEMPEGYVMHDALELLARVSTVIRMHVWAELHIPRHTRPDAVRADVPPQGVWVPPCIAKNDPRVTHLAKLLESHAKRDESGPVVLARREFLARLMCEAGMLSHAETKEPDSAADDGACPVLAATRCNETEQANIDEYNAFFELTKNIRAQKMRDSAGNLVPPYTPLIADAIHITQVDLQMAGLQSGGQPADEARAHQRLPDDPYRYSIFQRYYLSTLYDADAVATKVCRDSVIRGFSPCSPEIVMIGIHPSGETRWAVRNGPPPALTHFLSCFVYGQRLSDNALAELRSAHVRPERRTWMLCASFVHAFCVWLELVRVATTEYDAEERVEGDSERDDDSGSEDSDADEPQRGGAEARRARVARLDIGLNLPAVWL